MTDKAPRFYIKDTDGITRGLDEHYDTIKDVEQDPYGALEAIQDLWVERDKLREALETVVKEYELMPWKPPLYSINAHARPALGETEE